jgi:hypothetical protein
MVIISAQIYAALASIVIIFQACLAAGMPWGAASMGGKFKGKYPPKMRVVAVVNMLILMFLTSIVFAKAELFFLNMLPFAKIAIWGVVVFAFIGTILNTITPSKIERIWAPLALIHFITSIIVALN